MPCLAWSPSLDAVERATAANPKDLPKEQAAVAYWLSKKYRVAPEPLSALVAEAYEMGRRTKLDPTLILAIMAVESGFNPFAQSAVGAQGLMQVMTQIHSDKYENFGGKLAAFDPVTNLRVGVKVLQECIARAGSVEGGLKLYVGAGNMEGDGGYAAKVMGEHARLCQVARGRAMPTTQPARSSIIPVLGARRSAAAASRKRSLQPTVCKTPRAGGRRSRLHSSPCATGDRRGLPCGVAALTWTPERPSSGQPLGSVPPLFGLRPASGVQPFAWAALVTAQGTPS